MNLLHPSTTRQAFTRPCRCFVTGMSNTPAIICPLCNDPVEKLLYRFHYDNEKQVIERIKEHNPGWAEHDGACSRCFDYYHTTIVMEQRVLPEIGPYFPVKSADDYIILPSGLRLDADSRYTGRGITICFIDSGFFLHPDLTTCNNRIQKVVDITREKRPEKYFTAPHPESWHGTMTSVVCAGDGYLSHGLYKGIASNASLVLLKVQNDAGRITTENIVKALEWVLKNYKKYDIRIVNMSLGDDEPISYQQSEIDRLAEELTDKGIIIVAAAGNDPNGSIKPPANSPRVISVGGLDDQNDITTPLQLYHSSYGQTVDGWMKPELIAPAIWIAAPILPGTAEQEEAEALHKINPPDEATLHRIQSGKYISSHYMHVDGTSFAAPIVSAVIAQMLEADPQLSPPQVREILFSTAKRITDHPAERQGFGIIQPRKALLKTLRKQTFLKPYPSPYINKGQQVIEFFVQHECAYQVSLAGSFNRWTEDVLLLEPGEKGLWKIQIPMLPSGKYQYKFFVDEKYWLEDFDNPFREPDGFHGFNSLLIIEN